MTEPVPRPTRWPPIAWQTYMAESRLSLMSLSQPGSRRIKERHREVGAARVVHHDVRRARAGRSRLRRPPRRPPAG